MIRGSGSISTRKMKWFWNSQLSFLDLTLCNGIGFDTTSHWLCLEWVCSKVVHFRLLSFGSTHDSLSFPARLKVGSLRNRQLAADTLVGGRSGRSQTILPMVNTTFVIVIGSFRSTILVTVLLRGDEVGRLWDGGSSFPCRGSTSHGGIISNAFPKHSIRIGQRYHFLLWCFRPLSGYMLSEHVASLINSQYSFAVGG